MYRAEATLPLTLMIHEHFIKPMAGESLWHGWQWSSCSSSLAHGHHTHAQANQGDSPGNVPPKVAAFLSLSTFLIQYANITQQAGVNRKIDMIHLQYARVDASRQQ